MRGVKMQEKCLNYSTARIYTQSLAKLRVLAKDKGKSQIKMIDEIINTSWDQLMKSKSESEIDILDSSHIKVKTGIERV
tara:strand:+ start:9130 stop:9366 length:237 start_codon:yes stop_codon:yes gene_type:complete